MRIVVNWVLGPAHDDINAPGLPPVGTRPLAFVRPRLSRPQHSLKLDVAELCGVHRAGAAGRQSGVLATTALRNVRGIF